jgi:hypothetical protein
MGLKTSKWNAMLALPMALALAVVVSGCSSDDPVLGSATITDATVATTVPATPITTGAYSGTSLTIPANTAPANANVTVAPFGGDLTNSPVGPVATFDNSAGPAITITLNPPGTVLTAPGATLTIPFRRQALVDQGFAADVDSVTAGIVESSVFIYKTSNDGMTTEVLTPVAGSADMTARTVQVSGILSFSRFQGIIDTKAVINNITGQDSGRLPNGQWFDDYGPVQLTAAGGVGASKVEIEGTGAVSLTWAAVSGLPTGMTLSASGQLAGRPETATPLTAVTNHEIVVSVTDVAGRVTNRTFMVNFAEAGIPVILTSSLPSATVGVAYDQNLSIVGAGGSDLGNYTWASNPSDEGGIAFSGGNFSGTPAAISGSSADLTFSVTATDSNSLSSLPSTQTVRVYNPVEITTTSLPNAEIGVAYNETIGVTGGNGNYTFSIAGSVPAGLTFNAGTGSITGTPTDANDAQTFTVTVADTDTNAATPSSRTDMVQLSIIFNLVPTVSGVTVTGTSGTVSVEFSFVDDDDDGNFYSASIWYSVAGGAFVQSSNVLGHTTGLSEGGPFTITWNTGFSVDGDKVAINAAASVVVQVRVTDTTVGNTGIGAAAAVTIDNTQGTPSASNTTIIAQRITVPASSSQVTVEIMLSNGPEAASALEFKIGYNSAVLTPDPNTDEGFGITKGVALGPVSQGGANKGVAGNVPSPGTLAVVISALNTNAIPNGVLITVRFDVAPSTTAQDVVLTVFDITGSTPGATGIASVAGIDGIIVLE